MSNVFPMPHPPGCTCGCRGTLLQPCPPGNPGWGNWGFQLRECFQQVSDFKKLIQQILDELGGPVRTGPIIGDVTGNAALPGQVGETAVNIVNGAYTAAYQVQSVAAIILQPGDWDIQAKCTLTGTTPAANIQINGAQFQVSPMPSGLDDNMFAAFPVEYTIASGAGVDVASYLPVISNIAHGVFSQPTLIAFQLQTNFGAGAAGLDGTFQFITYARRAR